MAANPEPEQAVGDFDRQGPIVETDPGGPETADLLQVNRRVSGVALQEREGPVRKIPYLVRESAVARPESRRGVVIQSLVD